ncbi:MAG: hypothetical protein FWE76_02865, partial [Symbiobacteriaceae bacterium]|nr:hypothetical protein [Symbiobacteriaceae bacterium]
FATELWDLIGRSGVKTKGFQAMAKLSPQEQEEIQLKTLRWNDEVMGGICFFPWTAYVHPQLGAVEIGGWNPKEGRQNPPIALLEEECEKNMRFSLMHIESLPQLAIRNVNCQRVSEGVYLISAAVENTGFLPTSSTQKAINNRITAPVKAFLCGGTVLRGESEITVGHLQGRSATLSQGPYGGGSSPGLRKKVEWLVEVSPGERVTIIASGDRAGTVKQTVCLKN